jgi:hypothetical protein
VDSLHTGKLIRLVRFMQRCTRLRTICLATMTTVLTEKRRLQWSNRSSRLGPRRSMTSMLCKPSWPK